MQLRSPRTTRQFRPRPGPVPSGFRTGSLVLATICILSAAAPRIVAAYSGGPPDGACGDPPGGMFCTACHSSFPLNSGNGILSLGGLPESYVPGQVYPITVRLSDNYQSRWGFELTVIRPGDGTEGGALAITDAVHTLLSPGAGNLRVYVKHTLAGTFAGTDSARWSFQWTAPPAGTGPVRFYLAGNAANNNNANTNDYIYGFNRTVGEGSAPAAVGAGPNPGTNPETASATNPAGGTVTLRNYPEPARDETTLEVRLPRPAPLALRVVDTQGRLVRSFSSGPERGDAPVFRWDLSDQRGRPLPAGVYFYLLDTPWGGFTRRFTMIARR